MDTRRVLRVVFNASFRAEQDGAWIQRIPEAASGWGRTWAKTNIHIASGDLLRIFKIGGG